MGDGSFLEKLTIQGDSVVNVSRVKSKRLPSVLGQDRCMSGRGDFFFFFLPKISYPVSDKVGLNPGLSEFDYFRGFYFVTRKEHVLSDF